MEEMAQNYGWSLAVLNSNRELKGIFNRAVENQWTPQKFVAQVRGTRWYRRHGEAARQAAVMKESDPAEWKRRNQQMQRVVRGIHAELQGGRNVPADRVRKVAETAVTLGWTEEEIRFNEAQATRYRHLMERDNLGGEAGQLQDFVEKTANDYGVKVSDDWTARRVKAAMMGRDSQSGLQNHIQSLAKQRYRAFSDQIDQGVSVRDIAEGYIQSKSQTLEMNPAEISLFDQDIQRALTATSDKGTPEPVQMWEFERDLRRDPRWMKTQNAQDNMMNVGQGILQQFGLTT